jgi:hypothetical protein
MWRALALVVVLAAGGAGATAASPGKRCGDERQFGYVRSLVHAKGHWQLRFDPAQFTSGVTANTAAAEDHVIPKGQPMPNDNYVVNESKRTYLYYVSPRAHVTVLTPKSYVTGAPVSIDTLAQLVAGKKPIKLFEQLDTGFWMQYHVDTVCDLAQQYHP